MNPRVHCGLGLGDISYLMMDVGGSEHDVTDTAFGEGMTDNYPVFSVEVKALYVPYQTLLVKFIVNLFWSSRIIRAVERIARFDETRTGFPRVFVRQAIVPP